MRFEIHKEGRVHLTRFAAEVATGVGNCFPTPTALSPQARAIRARRRVARRSSW